jgi:predicted nucleotidyltransferase
MAQPLAPTSFARQPLDIILSRAAAIRVLRAIILHGGPLPVSRIALEAQLTPGGVRSVLDELVACRVIQVIGSGRTQLYQVPYDHPFCEPLKLLFAAEADRLNHMLNAVISAAERAADDRLRAVWLFGSVARGRDTTSSDLDIAVVVDVSHEWANKVGDSIRVDLDAVGSRLAYRPSVVSIAMKDVPGMAKESARLWTDIHAEAKTLKGFTPSQLLRHVMRDRVEV